MTHSGCLPATMDDEMGKIGPVPSGCGENRAIRPSRPRRWTCHSRRTRLRLARFSLAAPSTLVVLTGLRWARQMTELENTLNRPSLLGRAWSAKVGEDFACACPAIWDIPDHSVLAVKPFPSKINRSSHAAPRQKATGFPPSALRTEAGICLLPRTASARI